MFIDYVKVSLKAGDGGNGCVAFRREKYVPKGGPAGGNGGNGSDIVFRVDEGLSTLVSLRYNRLIKGKHGTHGKGSSMDGENAAPTIVDVPPGTVIKDLDGNLLADLIKHGEEAVIAKGGKGGKGNKFFKSNANKAPKISEDGGLGDEFEVVVELKLLADVGIIGFPNAGKSTFITMCTNSKAKIANYPFTTIVPNLGVARAGNGKEFVVADMPGLIEGASDGKGLGHEFLKHIERTSVLCHIIDMSGGEDDRNPIDDYAKINHEIEMFNQDLLLRPQIVVANKMDLDKSKDNLDKFKAFHPDSKVFEMIAITKEGISDVLFELAHLVEITPRFTSISTAQDDDDVLYKFVPEGDEFNISKDHTGAYIVSGEKIENLFQKTNFDQEDSVLRFARLLKKMGIEDELRKQGCENGDVVSICGFEFEMID